MPFLVWAMIAAGFRSVRLRSSASTTCVHVVPVDLDRIPTEGLELGANVADVHDLLGGPVGLKVVVVDDRRQVGDPKCTADVAASHVWPSWQSPSERTPKTWAAVVEAVEAQRETDPHAHREALSEGARRHLDARSSTHVGVALKLRPDLPQAGEVLEREVAVLRERRVLDRRGVALAEHEPVAAAPLGVLGVVAQHAVVERRDDVRRRERRVEMPGLRYREHPHAVESQHGRPALELGDPWAAPRRARPASGGGLGSGTGLRWVTAARLACPAIEGARLCASLDGNIRTIHVGGGVLSL